MNISDYSTKAITTLLGSHGLGDLLDSGLEEVAQGNLDKVLSRKARGVQGGSGDNR